jgi:AbrB family looped-hinge helix DNA binding protein
MAKVTSKLQITLPKRLAEQFAIRPGDDIEWMAAHDSIRVVPARGRSGRLDMGARLKLFDRATERQRRRQAGRRVRGAAPDRGWTREDLYDRGRTR